VREIYLGLTVKWVGASSHREVMLCGWGVKTGMARVCCQVKL